MKSPIKFITFGRFGSEENWKKEREQFLQYKKELINMLSGFEIKEKSLEGIEETKINEMIKIYIKECKSILLIPLGIFMRFMGLSYIALSNEERNEIEEMDFTYENWKKKSKILYDKFLKNSLDIFPMEVKFCFEDKFFPLYVIVVKEDIFKKNNFITFIRDYFILDDGYYIFNEFRDEKLFNDLQKKIIKIYPIIKEKYGTNRYIEKFFSYMNPENKKNDYNNKYIKNILDNYYKGNKNNDELEKLKED